MKKIVLSVLIAGSLLATSCKETKKGATDLKDATVETAGAAVDATKDAATTTADAVVDKAKDMVSSALEGVSIPAFKDAKVTEYLKSYATYAKDYIAKKGDVLKAPALAKKGADLLAKGKAIAANLDAEELTKYKSVLSAIQSKMAPSN